MILPSRQPGPPDTHVMTAVNNVIGVVNNVIGVVNYVIATVPSPLNFVIADSRGAGAAAAGHAGPAGPAGDRHRRGRQGRRALARHLTAGRKRGRPCVTWLFSGTYPSPI